MEWFILIVAGILEMVAVAFIGQYNKKKSYLNLCLMLLSFLLSFLCLSFAMESIPMGTAYAIWTGIGACGGAIIGMLMFNESRHWIRMLCILSILMGAIGLKLVS